MPPALLAASAAATFAPIEEVRTTDDELKRLQTAQQMMQHSSQSIDELSHSADEDQEPKAELSFSLDETSDPQYVDHHADADDKDNDDHDDSADSTQPQRTTTKTPTRQRRCRNTTTNNDSPSKAAQPTAPVKTNHRYTCDMCGRGFADKVRLAGHLRQHCGLQPFPCAACPKEFDKHSKLLAHQKRKHSTVAGEPEPDEPTSCPHEGCGKTYRLPRFAQDHYERIHLGLRPKVRAPCMCDTCGKSFMTRSSLQQHMKSHMAVEEYPYRCEECGKRFLAKNGYQLHMLRHQNIRNFPCPLCPSRMVSQLELNYHVAKHDKSVPWPCPECTMVFQRKGKHTKREISNVESATHLIEILTFVQRVCGGTS